MFLLKPQFLHCEEWKQAHNMETVCVHSKFTVKVKLSWKEKKPQTQMSHIKEPIELCVLSGSTEVTENKACAQDWSWRCAGAMCWAAFSHLAKPSLWQKSNRTYLNGSPAITWADKALLHGHTPWRFNPDIDLRACLVLLIGIKLSFKLISSKNCIVLIPDVGPNVLPGWNLNPSNHKVA